MNFLGARLTALILALAFGDFLFLRARSAWTNHWLLSDTQQCTGLVTGEHWSGHNAVDYQYIVDQEHYSGHSARNGKDQKKVQVGDHVVVYFSASHPWLSLLYLPEDVLGGFPFILIALAFEGFAVITIINPKNGWAFSLIEKEQKE